MDEVSIEIAAPRAKVWDLIADFPQHGQVEPGVATHHLAGRRQGAGRSAPGSWASTATGSWCGPRCPRSPSVTKASRSSGKYPPRARAGATASPTPPTAAPPSPSTASRSRTRRRSSKPSQKSGLIGRDREDLLRAGMQTTLERVKAAAEGDPGRGTVAGRDRSGVAAEHDRRHRDQHRLPRRRVCRPPWPRRYAVAWSARSART